MRCGFFNVSEPIVVGSRFAIARAAARSLIMFHVCVMFVRFVSAFARGGCSVCVSAAVVAAERPFAILIHNEFAFLRVACLSGCQ